MTLSFEAGMTGYVHSRVVRWEKEGMVIEDQIERMRETSGMY